METVLLFLRGNIKELSFVKYLLYELQKMFAPGTVWLLSTDKYFLKAHVLHVT